MPTLPEEQPELFSYIARKWVDRRYLPIFVFLTTDIFTQCSRYFKTLSCITVHTVDLKWSVHKYKYHRLSIVVN